MDGLDFISRVHFSSQNNVRLKFNHPLKEILWLKEKYEPKFERKYCNFIILTKEEELKNNKNMFEKKFYEDLFAGKITVNNEINDETIDNYIKKFTYDLSDFLLI